VVNLAMAGDGCLTDQLRELECQSVQVTLLILLQRYDIIHVERTGDVIYDIIKY
jgi:hypothetical protein